MNLELLRAIVAHPQDLVLCTVLRVRGSAPRHAGSKMLVGREGRLLGSVAVSYTHLTLPTKRIV